MGKKMYSIKVTATIRQPFGKPEIKELPVFHIDPELHGVTDKQGVESIVKRMFQGLTGFGTTVQYSVSEIVFSGDEITA